MSTRPRPVSETTKGGKRRRLTEPFVHEWEHDGTKMSVKVPADGHGYEVSAPRPLRALMALFAPYYALEDVSAAHDYLYRKKGFEEEAKIVPDHEPWDGSFTRAEADAVMLSDPDDPTWLQYAAWAYTRAFGWWAWHDYSLWSQAN